MTLYRIIAHVQGSDVQVWRVAARGARSARRKAEAIGIVVVKVERERKKR